MFAKSRIVIALGAILISHTLSAQVAIGEWRDHFPYKNTIAVAAGHQKVYCATPYALFSYNTEDQSLERLTKINALSDIGVNTINFSNHKNALVVGYANGNIDLIKENTTVNMSDIKRNTTLIGDKSINHIYLEEELAYLSCGFGIVVLDLDREEVKATYLIGPLGSQVKVNAVATDATHIYAATDEGLYFAALDAPNLSFYENWSKDQTVPHASGPFNTITQFDGEVHVNYDNPLEDTESTFYYDTIYVKTDGDWSVYEFQEDRRNRFMTTSNGLLAIAHEDRNSFFDTEGAKVKDIVSYSNGAITNPSSTISAYGVYWVADRFEGLVRSEGFSNRPIYPAGPAEPTVFRMAMYNDNLFIVPGGAAPTNWSNFFLQAKIFAFQEESWNSLEWDNQELLDGEFDMVSVAIDPSDQSRAYAGSWGGGLFEIVNGSAVEVFTPDNSSLLPNKLNENWTGVAALAFDADNNLWACTSFNDAPINVKTPAGEWFSFSPPESFSSGSSVHRGVLPLFSGHKWIIRHNGGIMAFDDNGTLDNSSDDNYQLLSQELGSGGLPSKFVLCLAQDLDGEVWVGTSSGVAVFYNPDEVFSGEEFDAQQILIEQNGVLQILLETETVTDIEIDGANRKWIGTENAGAFLISADGTEQLKVFNTDNSPIFSNQIKDIAINHGTGEVFFGTEKGVISYRGTATTPAFEAGTPFVFPNPVREDYSGPIAIKGLVNNSDVHIADISGNVVFQTSSEGGQAVWDGKNFDGQRVGTGVYLVFCTNADGSETAVAKILFVN